MSPPVHVTMYTFAPVLVLGVGPGLVGVAFDDVALLQSLRKVASITFIDELKLLFIDGSQLLLLLLNFGHA